MWILEPEVCVSFVSRDSAIEHLEITELSKLISNNKLNTQDFTIGIIIIIIILLNILVLVDCY